MKFQNSLRAHSHTQNVSNKVLNALTQQMYNAVQSREITYDTCTIMFDAVICNCMAICIAETTDLCVHVWAC